MKSHQGGAIPPLAAIAIAIALLTSACSSGSSTGITGDTLPEPDPDTTAVDSGDGETSDSETSDSETSDDGQDADDSADDDGDGGDDGEPPTTEPAATAVDPPWTTQELVLNTIAETEEPVSLVGRSGTGDLYVANKTGTVERIVRNTRKNQPDAFSVDGTPVLDLTEEVSGGNEQGLLDLVFSSDGRKLYVSYTDTDGDNVIERYNMGSRTADTSSRVEVLRQDQPFSNHNGGGMSFGPDGFLYVGLGDGGRAGDPQGSGQDTDSLLGSILRIDPDGAVGDEGYAVPNGNPYLDGGGAPEVWLKGVRNPWRFSFDSETDELWIADVGQDRFEEVNLITDGGRAANLGWNLMEGAAPFDGATEPADHTPPFLTYAHEKNRCSVTGGFVYRGQFLTNFTGVYVFGDYCSGETFGLVSSPGGTIWRKLSLQLGRNQLGSFGIDNDGELYVLNLNGAISRLEPTEEDIEAARIAAEEAEAEAEAQAEADAIAEAEAEAIDEEEG